MLFAIIAILAVGIIIYAGIVFNKSDRSQTTFERIISIIVLIVLVAGCGALGLMGAGEVMPIILSPFLLFFFVCIYTAKEDRAKQYGILKEMNEKLEKMEEELALRKKTNEIVNTVYVDDINPQENSNTDGI